MAITYSTNLKLTLIGTGDQAGTWGNTTNTNLGTLIEQAIAGYVSQTVADSASSTSLSIADGTSSVARNMVLVLQGALSAARDIILPTSTKLYFIHNNTSGGFAVTAKCSGQTGVSIPNGAKVILACNGTDIVEAFNYSGSLIFPTSATITTLSGTTLGYGSASITNASIASGTVTNLLATTFSGGSASITTVTGTTFGTTGASQIRGASGAIGQLTVTSATITNLNVTSLTTGNFPLPTSATIATLSGTTLSYASASLTNATISSNLNLSGGTANGVAYLNGSKNLTTGSALTFNGSTLNSPQFYQSVSAPTTYSTQVLENTASNGYSQLLLNVGVSGANGQASISYAPTIFFAIGPVANDTTSPIIFRNNNATERMRLDASGNLGIGTSSPLAPLHVYRASASSVRIDTDASASSTQLNFATAGVNKWSLYRPSSSSDLRMFDNATAIDVMTWQAGGNVGVGTSSPASKLDVAGTSALSWGVSANPALVGNVTLNSPSGGSFAIRTATANDTYQSGLGVDGTYNGGKSVVNLKAFGVYSGGPYSSDLAFYTTSTTTSSEKMRIDSAGNLGLGVTPSNWTSTLKAIEVGYLGSSVYSGGQADMNMTSNAYFNSGWKYGGTGGASKIALSENSFALSIAPSGTAGNAISFTQAMTLDASGNLSVGATSVAGWGSRLLTKSSTDSYFGGIAVTANSVDSGIFIGHNATVGAIGTSYGSTGAYTPLTFLTGGAERMRIDSSGNVGIGTTSPTQKLTVNGNVAVNAGFLIPYNGVTPTGYIGYGTSLGTANDISIRSDTGNILFGFSGSEKMRLDTAGNLGLGVTPSAWGSAYKALDLNTRGLSLAGGTDSGAVSVNAYWNSGWKYAGTSAYRVSQYQQFDGAHTWHNAPSGTAGNAISFTQAMTLDASGNLGIGTSTPSARVDARVANIADGTDGGIVNVYSTTAQAADVGGKLALGGLYDGSNYLSFAAVSGRKENSTSGDWSGYMQFSTRRFGGGFAERMRIDSSGNLLVGTTTSAYKTTAYVSGQDGFCVQNSATGTGTGNGTLFGLDSSSNGIMWSFDAVNLVFGNTNTERMRIDTAGNVGIGTSSPGERLNVVGGGATSSTVNLTGGNGFDNATIASDYSLVFQVDANNNVGGREFNWRVGGKGYSDGTSLMLLNSAGNLGIGTSSPTVKLDVAGSILASGNVTAYSDIRVKDNVESIEGAIEKLSQIRGVTYTRTDLEDKERRFAGVIAQEIEQVLPEAVFDNGKVKAVDYNATIALLIEAVKQQQGQINELKLTIEQLKGN